MTRTDNADSPATPDRPPATTTGPYRTGEARAVDEGRLVSGYEGRSCAADHCEVPLTAETGAYLHKNRENGKLVLFCEACSVEVQMNHALRLPLVAL